MTATPTKTSKIIDMFSSKGVLVFVVSAVWMVRGWYAQLEQHDVWIKQAQPIMQNLIQSSTNLKDSVESLNARISLLEKGNTK